MKKIIILALVVLFIASNVYAGWDNGYTRKDGTYVRGHYWSNPDGVKWNNYGRSKNEVECLNP